MTTEAEIRAMFDRLATNRSTSAHARIADAWAAMDEHKKRVFVEGFVSALNKRNESVDVVSAMLQMGDPE